MLRLENIRKNGVELSADFYPENSVLCGYIIVDAEKREVIAFEDVEGYGYAYRGHAAWALYRLFDEKKITESKTVIWN